MCTVTFIPTKNGVFLTSNRDEHDLRSTSFAPEKKLANGYEIIYPKDPDAGGSWIAVKDNHHCAVLFNGAFTKHIASPPYSKSRGIVFLEIIQAEDPVKHCNNTDLSGVEPFSIILYAPGDLRECRWDGKQKHNRRLLPTVPHIWSSATLYDKAAQSDKEGVFRNWMKTGQMPNQQDIVQLHNQLLLKKENGISTVSITCISIDSKTARLSHYDLPNKTTATVQINKQEINPGNRNMMQSLMMTFRRTWIKATHWEYWPFAVVYAPVLPYWFWLSLKARSFFFFSSANTSIENAGFVLEKKSRIYDLIPVKYYPKTLLFKKGSVISQVDLMLEKHQLLFPLIAKPDIGQKGMQVKLLQSNQDLANYARDTQVDFLLQEYIPYKQEVGIFYYRIPGESKGHISGIVGKEFLGVTGDGVSTIEELLEKEDRFVLQLPVLKFTYGKSLYEILPTGTIRTLVPYGNHSRGAKFIDLSHKINSQLSQTIDSVCQQIPGFYYGRLDIKFNEWDELCEGKIFSIIELNGAGSEPTHMYDPVHSIFFAWREIIRHWNVLYRISRLNAKQSGLRFMETSKGLKMLKDNSAYVKLIS